MPHSGHVRGRGRSRQSTAWTCERSSARRTVAGYGQSSSWRHTGVIWSGVNFAPGCGAG
jgi:hypothetical protein